MIHNIFGSPNGNDVDVLILVQEPFTISFLDKKKIQAKEMINIENVDINFVCVNDGVLSWVSYGSIWETNDALYSTYHLHEQNHPCFVNVMIQPSDEDIMKKLHRSIRNLLAVYTRTVQYKDIAKASLSPTVSLENKIQVLKEINHSNITWREDRNDPKKISEQIKRGVYQIGQSILLLKGSQAYTKQGLALAFPTMKWALYRESFVGCMPCLDDFVRIFVDTIVQKGIVNLE